MAASLPMLPHIRRLLDPSALDLGSDAALLSRFVEARDEESFAVLVARHGPMVLRLCRRVLGDAHAAEDACQATFLVLARKAGDIRHAEALAAWLHGVAYRLALKGRAGEARRQQAETRSLQIASSSPIDPLAEVSGRELLAILDAELQRLPERYRLPLILCCLEGRSQPEAARLLGWTAGSVKGRLERGRAKLHQRLLRRGLTLPTALLALEAAQGTATARMPVALTASVLRSAAAVGAGTAATKIKISLILVLMFGVVAGGASMVASGGGEPPRG
jgi:RNA polymerase sigma factor (sigma-70 family)